MDSQPDPAESFSTPEDALAAAFRLDVLGRWDAAIAMLQAVAGRWPDQAKYCERTIQGIQQKIAVSTPDEDSPSPRRRWRGRPLLPIAVRTSLLWAFAALVYDFSHGSFLISMLACPPWFLVSVIRSVWVRPGWPVAFVRAVIPLAVLAAVLANDAHQRSLAKANAEKVVNAIRSFRDGSGRYPTDLQELVPGQLDSVPRPKQAHFFNTFFYAGGGSDSAPILWWIDVPPHGKRVYNFDEARWSFID